MRGRSRGQNMVLLASGPLPEGQLRPLTTRKSSSPSTSSHHSGQQTRAALDDAASRCITGPTAHLASANASDAPDSRAAPQPASARSRWPPPRELTSHEQLVAAYSAKQQAFEARQHHDPTALTSPPRPRQTAHHPFPAAPQQQSRPLSQNALQLRQHHHHNQQPQQQQKGHSAPVKCIMPGILHSLAQAARVDPYRGGGPPLQPMRPPKGPSAPLKRSHAALGSDHCSDGPPGHRRRRVDGSAASGGINPQQHLGVNRSRGYQRLQQGAGAGRRDVGHLRVVAAVGRAPLHERLHSFFSRRNRELSVLGHRTRRFQREATAELPVGLLALPEDVLLLVICKLEHREIGSLFAVCRELRATMDTAMMLHFNVQTPHHPAAALVATASDGVSRPLPPVRPGRRAPAAAPAASGASGQTSMDGETPRAPAAPRALMFEDSEATGAAACGGSGHGCEEVSSEECSLAPLLPPLTFPP